jgi:hypothetical protein
MLRRALLLTALIAVAGCPSGAWGRSLVDIDIVDRDTGQWLPETPFRGDTWVAGTPGHRYSVRLTNTTGERVLVVLSVDGVNAVTGQTANPAQTGYVLAPWQSAEISGWRKSMDDVAQFVFTDLPDSYAARTGRPDNVGVIGIAVFREARPIAYVPPAVPPPWMEDSRGNQAPQAKSAAPAAESSAADAYGGVARQRIGTGHGAREWSPVGQTQFERASSRPAQVIQVRYDDVATLAALGILPRTPWYMPSRDAPRPEAFPGGFVPDPPNG